jgi:hypothetical protein
VLCGGEDGMVRAWDGGTVAFTDTAASCLLPHCMLGSLAGGKAVTGSAVLAAQANRPVHCCAWNPYLNMVAMCGWGSWSPLLLAVHDPQLPPIKLGCEDTPHAPRRRLVSA